MESWDQDVASWADDNRKDPQIVKNILIKKGWEPSKYTEGMKAALRYYLDEWYTLSVKKLPKPATATARRNPDMSITDIINQVIVEWMNSSKDNWPTWGALNGLSIKEATYQINDGLCDMFAQEVIDRMGGYSNTLTDGTTPSKLFWEGDYPGHVWISYRGRAYDAEAPEGKDRWEDLPIFINRS